MYNIWSKTYKEQKIKKSMTTKMEGQPDFTCFEETLRDLCHELDIPTPMVLTKHISDLTKFNLTRFKVEDFIESVNFDFLQIEIY